MRAAARHLYLWLLCAAVTRVCTTAVPGPCKGGASFVSGLFGTVARVVGSLPGSGASVLQATEPCFNGSSRYSCATGLCCGDTDCCTSYHQQWWFWLILIILSLLICLCIFRCWQAKLRRRQQQRQSEINRLTYQASSTSFLRTQPCYMQHSRFLADTMLPRFIEVARHPLTPPPPYCAAEIDRHPEVTDSVQGQEYVIPSDPEESAHRHRHQTGDSGIEVCACDGGAETTRAEEGSCCCESADSEWNEQI